MYYMYMDIKTKQIGLQIAYLEESLHPTTIYAWGGATKSNNVARDRK
jgi:hypothetical protein